MPWTEDPDGIDPQTGQKGRKQLVLEEPYADYAVELEQRARPNGETYQLIALQPLDGSHPAHRFEPDAPELRFWRRRHPELAEFLDSGQPGNTHKPQEATGPYADASSPEHVQPPAGTSF